MSTNYQFIGPLKPGQKPPPRPSISNRDDEWTILDLLSNPPSEATIQVIQSANASSDTIGKIRKPKKFIRAAGGTTWEDPSLAEWDPEDFRVFCGDLGNDVTDEMLTATFEKYPSFVKAKVVRDKRTGKSKGYGFISFKDAQDYAKAIKDWDGKYLGCRPIKLRKSAWKDRLLDSKKPKTAASTSTDLMIEQAPTT